MSPRRQALRQYLLEVARDLVRRGAMRQKRGQSLDEILRLELPALARGVQEDLTALAIELGVAVVSSGVIGGAVQKRVDELVGVGVQKLVGLIKRR